MAESFGRVRKPLMSDMLAAQRRKDAAKADKSAKSKFGNGRDLAGGMLAGTAAALGIEPSYGTGGRTPSAAATPTKTGPKAPTSKPKSAAPAKSSKPKSNGSAGTASNRDLPGKTTITYAQGPKRDVAALQARSKASLDDSKAAAASRGNGPGGGAERVLASYRGQKPKRETGR